MFSGVASALGRFFIAMFVSLFGFIRVDVPLFPSWILKIVWIDATNKTYISLIKIYHYHNHPIAISFA